MNESIETWDVFRIVPPSMVKEDYLRPLYAKHRVLQTFHDLLSYHCSDEKYSYR